MPDSRSSAGWRAAGRAGERGLDLAPGGDESGIVLRRDGEPEVAARTEA
jgi:hypothetical protein